MCGVEAGMAGWRAALAPALVGGALLAGCASTTVAFDPPQPAALCEPDAAARVLWASRWRVDQKDVAARERAAEDGLRIFLLADGCFARAELRRVEALDAVLQAERARASSDGVVMLGIEIQELGPIVRLFASPALVEGGTQVVFRVLSHPSHGAAVAQAFTVRWQNGGPGVIKGVEHLRDDMRAALRSGLLDR